MGLEDFKENFIASVLIASPILGAYLGNCAEIALDRHSFRKTYEKRVEEFTEEEFSESFKYHRKNGFVNLGGEIIGGIVGFFLAGGACYLLEEGKDAFSNSSEEASRIRRSQRREPGLPPEWEDQPSSSDYSGSSDSGSDSNQSNDSDDEGSGWGNMLHGRY